MVEVAIGAVNYLTINDVSGDPLTEVVHLRVVDLVVPRRQRGRGSKSARLGRRKEWFCLRAHRRAATGDSRGSSRRKDV